MPIGSKHAKRASIFLITCMASAACVSTGANSDPELAEPSTEVTSTTVSQTTPTENSNTTIGEDAQTDIGGSLKGLPVGDGTTITRVTAVDGSVFALRLPESFGTRFGFDEIDGSESIASISGDSFGARIEIGFCTDEPLRINTLGLSMGPVLYSKPPPSLSFCRPDEFLRLVIKPVPDVEITADQFDIVPVSFGDHYVDWIRANVGLFGQCCFEDRGPMWFEDLMIVSDGYGSTQISALDSTTLIPRWTNDLVTSLHDQVDFVGDGSYLYMVTETGVIVATTGHGWLFGLDAQTGDLLWTVDLDGQTPGGVARFGNDHFVVTSSITSEGDVSAPTVRLVDMTAGRELWAAPGNPGTELQWGGPLVFDRMAIVADVPSYQESPKSAGSASVTAFDVETGERRWKASLESETEAYASFDTLVSDTQRNLLLATSVDGVLFRLDPKTGEQQWRSEIGYGPVIGLALDTVTVLVRGQEIDLDLKTGQPTR